MVPLLGVLLVTPSSDGSRDDEEPPLEDGTDSAEAARTVGTSPPVALPFDPEDRTAYAYELTYSPGGVRASVGDLVVFDNADDVAHTFTDDDGRFDSGPVEPGKQYGFAYSSPGTYSFHCELHPTMRGQVRIDPLEEE